MLHLSILTISDKCSRDEREDYSGFTLKKLIAEKGWHCLYYEIIPDDLDTIINKLETLSLRKDCDIIITTGGTGLSSRDVTPEATSAVIKKELPGIPELLRAKSYEYTHNAVLSRAVAGISSNTLIINFPGSPKACHECFEIVSDIFEHAVAVLNNNIDKCGRT